MVADIFAMPVYDFKSRGQIIAKTLKNRNDDVTFIIRDASLSSLDMTLALR